MNHTEYAAAARALYDAPLVSTETPPGQKYPIGTRVRYIGGKRSIFKAGLVGTVEYTYAQKYRPGCWLERDCDRELRQYSLKTIEHGSCAWFDESELQLESDEPILLPEPPPEQWEIDFGNAFRDAFAKAMVEWLDREVTKSEKEGLTKPGVGRHS